MLRGLIQKETKEQHKALGTFEFKYNSSKHKSTGLSPFDEDIGRVPLPATTKTLMDCTVQCQSTFNVIKKQKIFTKLARDNLALARARQKYYADQHWRGVQ